MASQSQPEDLESLKTLIRSHLHQYPDFPTKGILFEDIMPIFNSPIAFKSLIKAFVIHLNSKFPNTKIDAIIGLESRGFLFGPTLALELNAGFIPIRKQGKLPGETISATYEKEYGTDVFEIQANALKPNQNVIIVDDIIATGGSAKAAGDLVEKLNGNVLEFLFLMELDFLKGREKLNSPVYTLLSGQPEKL